MTRYNCIHNGLILEYISLGYNCLEAVVAITAGLLAGSIALVGFGFDSVIEVTSSIALLWRLNADVDQHRRDRAEAASLRIVGLCFVGLAFYITYESIRDLWHFSPPERSLPGIVLAAVSLVAMPLLARAKRRVARKIDSRALMADAKQTEFCTYLSAILLGGLLLNAVRGWWWADPVAALIMVPIIAREGLLAFRGDACSCYHCHASLGGKPDDASCGESG